ncbi:LuxR C-terminal-related transcriptional regulator [Agrobacterium rosae]|uniref:helix-turn-helix transcriptional regulator n=1 Tax=Agrobacterium rosae TaxID=1972867 RepID=UPI002A115932|nr:LuxR C-terminal-related transcriptional regulator [Agrobacterium rosae]MDX8317084.1 LuxR C-terminal-related transcriptional regulator [Agrobacterium rosae]
MKNHASFKLIARMMTDAWIYSPDGNRDAAGIYARILEMLRPNMILAVVDTRANNPDDFALHVVSGYELPTAMSAMRHLQVSRSLLEFPDQQHLRSIMIPAYVKAIENRRPLTDRIAASILDMVTIYDRLILPQRNPACRSEWCLVLIDVKFLLPPAPKQPLADVDLGILQLLAEGATIKEIAEVSYRSDRTIHHRVERLKARFGARNLAHLVGLSVSAGIADDPSWEG